MGALTLKNLDYFNFSQKNIDEFIDLSNPEGVLVVSRSKDEKPTNLMVANDKLIDFITTYETLKANRIGNYKNLCLQTLDHIIDLIENTPNINYSSFCAYFQVVGFSYGAYMGSKSKMSIDEKRELFQNLIDLYIKYRHKTYKYLGYSNQILQVNSDLSSSRRKGKTGIEKIENIIVPLGFSHFRTIQDFYKSNLGYLLPDKGDKNLFETILKILNISFDFRKSRQNKNPDMFIKIGKDIFILEHKLTSGSGGAQNAEINEIIQFINFGEHNPHLHYISCLQGDFFSKLKSANQEPKSKTQYNDIIKALTAYERNFFVNGNGFEKLINDFLSGLKQ